MDPLGKVAQEISGDGEVEMVNEVERSTTMELSEQNPRLRNTLPNKDSHLER